MIVMKFGGSSVDSAASIERVVEIVRRHLPRRPIVVVSAMAKTTRRLLESAEAAALEELDHLVCSSCGITFREFRSQGRLGCPHDYIEFARELTPLLENIHGATQHVGKVPKFCARGAEEQTQLIRLRREMKEAVAAEEYERASQLRDEIRKMEQSRDETQK